MTKDDPEIMLERLLRTTQIITLALILGASTFLAIVLFVPGMGGRMAGADPILTWIALGGSVMAGLAAFVVPDIVGRQQVRRLRTNPTLRTFEGPSVPLPEGPVRDAYIYGAAFQTRLIIRLALLEGATFFCLVAHMLERQWPSLLAAAVLLGLMAANFPTRGRLDSWIGTLPIGE